MIPNLACYPLLNPLMTWPITLGEVAWWLHMLVSTWMTIFTMVNSLLYRPAWEYVAIDFPALMRPMLVQVTTNDQWTGPTLALLLLLMVWWVHSDRYIYNPMDLAHITAWDLNDHREKLPQHCVPNLLSKWFYQGLLMKYQMSMNHVRNTTTHEDLLKEASKVEGHAKGPHYPVLWGLPNGQDAR